MKKITLILAAVFLSLNAIAQDTLTHVNYNLRWGEHASMKQIADYISSNNPDFVTLQECDWATNRPAAKLQNGVKFINELAYHTGMFGLFGKTINHRGGYYGIGILSKYPIISSQRVLLPTPPKREQRGMLLADIELPSGEIVTLVTVHLGLSEEERLEQAEFIQKFFKGYKNKVVIAGDFNAQPQSAEIALFEKNWAPLSNDEFSFPATGAKIKIDYLYGKPAKDIELISADTIEGVTLSDHLPLVSKYILK